MQISAENGVFGQTGPKVGSFDAGYGSSHMARLVGKLRRRKDHTPSFATWPQTPISGYDMSQKFNRYKIAALKA